MEMEMEMEMELWKENRTIKKAGFDEMAGNRREAPKPKEGVIPLQERFAPAMPVETSSAGPILSFWLSVSLVSLASRVHFTWSNMSRRIYSEPAA